MLDAVSTAKVKQIAYRLNLLVERIQEDQAELKALSVELSMVLDVKPESDCADVVWGK